MLPLLGVTPRLLIRDARVFEPPRWVLATGIVMRPVDDAALVVPFVLAAELHGVAHCQTADPRSDVDVVSHQERLTGRKTQDETLVTPAVCVIRQDSVDYARVRHR